MRRAAGYNSDESRLYGPPIPNLPGAGAHGPMLPRARAQTLRFVNGYPIAEDFQVVDPLNRSHKWGDRPPEMGPTPPFAVHEPAQTSTLQQRDTDAMRQATDPATSSSSRRAAGLPKWIVYNGKILGFGAYFRENVPYSSLESWRVRKVGFRYFLESDQLEIVEAKEPNSGLPQGVLLHRMSAVKEDGSPLRWTDLRVGGEVTLYCRTYHIVAADPITRAFYSEHGQEQPPDEPYPEGPFEQHRKALEASQPRRPPVRALDKGPPLPPDMAPDPLNLSPRGPGAVFETMPVKLPPEIEARDNAVLRFLAAWDNSAAIFGEVLAFQVAYHVADGTVEVREVARRNSGRDPFPLLLRRSRLPKTLPPVMGRPMSPRTRHELHIQYYDWRDLFLGATVNVYGRSMLLYDCDDTTLAWLKKNVQGLKPEQLTRIQIDFDPFGPKRPPLAIPPNSSGFGSDEDSLQNVLHLVPRPVTRSYTDYLAKWNKVMRFAAVMVPLGPGRPLVGPHDAERRFILSFYPVDGTVGVWEPKQVNSGMEQGSFLERTRVPNPSTGQPYTESDMQVGAVLEVFGRGFQLMDADAFTLHYMEQNAYRFPWADYDKVLSKLLVWLQLYHDQLPDRLRGELLAADKQGSGYISKYQLYDLLTALGCDVTPHEVITLVRQLGADRQGLLGEQLLAALRLAPPPAATGGDHNNTHQHQHQHQAAAKDESPAPPAKPSVPFPGEGLRPGAWPPYRRVAWGPASLSGAQQPPGRPGTGLGGGGGGPAVAAHPPPPARGSGLGPVPGHPRVDPPPAGRHPAYLTGGASVDGKLSTRSSLLSPAFGGSEWDGEVEDDRRHPRDTPSKSQRSGSHAYGAAAAGAGPFGSSFTAAATAGASQGFGRALSGVAAALGGGGGFGAGSGDGGSQRDPHAGTGRPAVATGLRQPSSLWQTTNMAFGGVGHATSFQRR